MALKRIKIGFIIDWIENFYHSKLLAGINKGAEEFDFNVFVFVGGSFKTHKAPIKMQNIFYEYIKPENVDGLILSTTLFGRFQTNEQIRDYYQHTLGIPIVSLGEKVEQCASILVDNHSGMRELMVHLIEDHGYRKLAFLGGIETFRDAIERFSVYKEMLEHYNIPYDPQLVLHGNFMYEFGYGAVTELLDRRKLDFEVIVAANDGMAMGAIKALKERGIQVPAQVAVTGFDNQELFKYSDPSLTSVQLPIQELGYKGFEVLHSLIRKENIADVHYIPTWLVERESCGCPLNYNIAGNSPQPGTGQSEKSGSMHTSGQMPADFRHLAQDINAYLKSALFIDNDVFSLEETKELLTALHSAYSQKTVTHLNTVLKALFVRLKVHNVKLSNWQCILSLIRKHMLTALPDPELKDTLEDIFHDMRCFLSILAENNFGIFELKTESEIFTFRLIIENMTYSLDIEKLFQPLTEHFSDMGISSLYILRFQKPETDKTDITEMKLLYGYNDGKQILVDKAECIYPASLLFPSGFFPTRRRFSFLVEPLFFGDWYIGFLILEIKSPIDEVTAVMRRTLLQSILLNALFIDELWQQAEKIRTHAKELSEINEKLGIMLKAREKAEEEVGILNDELEKRVNRRTAELNDALDNLKKAEKDLVESEKMAALGGLVAGIAHEINTPIGIGVTAASHLERETVNLHSLFNGNNLTRTKLVEYMDTTQEATAMILANLSRANELIRSFKGIAVDQSSEIVRSFNMREYIQDVLLSLRPRLKRVRHQIRINCPDDLIIESYPGAFSQIITNLIMNSLIHAFDEHQAGNIIFDIRRENGMLHFIYSDDGKGISEKIKDRIFEPFVTTSRNKGGTGLGLHLVFNLTTQTLHGKIKCESENGKGVRFIFTIPVK